MKKIYLLLASALIINFCHAQNGSDTVQVKGADGMEKVFTRVDEEATFKGGMAAWTKYLQNNFEVDKVVKKMPAKKTTYSEVAMVRFIVSKSGEISNVEVENKVHSALRKEAIRLIKESPTWLPAMQKGKPVNAYRRQPITIEISNE